MGNQPGILIGTKDTRRRVNLTPIYQALGQDRAEAFPAFHVLTGSDTTGHINGVGKKGTLKCLLRSSSDTISILSMV